MSTISHLPLELLAEIAEFSLQRHPQEGYVTSSRTLAALSSASTGLRALATPILFRELALTTEDQLLSLSHVEPTLLARCQ